MKPHENSFTFIFNTQCKQLQTQQLTKISKKQRQTSSIKSLNLVEQLNEKNESFIQELRSNITELVQFRLTSANTLVPLQWKAIYQTLKYAINLKEIHISNSNIDNFPLFSNVLSTLSQLQSCELFSCQLNDSDAVQIATFTQNLISLKISDNLIGQRILDIINQAQQLKTLHIGGNQINDTLEEALEILANQNSLVSLGLRNTGISVQAAEKLNILLENSQIQDLQMRKNTLSNTIYHFTKSLRTNQYLRVLELQNAKLNHQSIELLAANLEGNFSLHALNLAQNDLTDESCVFIAQVIVNCRNLTTLNLDDTKISNLGITNIIIIIQQSQYISLSGISLSKNFISDSGLIALGQLSCTGQLTSLNLSHNAFTSSGFRQFSQILTSQKTRIRHLDVSGNEVYDAGGIALGGLLSQNKSIQRLFLTDCGIKENGMNGILAGLDSNTTIIQMAFGGQGENGNVMSKNVKARIDQRIKQNAEVIVVPDGRVKSCDEIDLMLDFHPVDSIGSQLCDVSRVGSLQLVGGIGTIGAVDRMNEFSFFTDQSERVGSLSDFGRIEVNDISNKKKGKFKLEQRE
ncbi:hypothetical protein SS50377_27816 [Spironucleus salmonicida]|uniref:Uncharacterized protein n=1 Tax=Spironucleus salmonicida TaxID=348837 RepID=V6M654_9EUKA|nr:hypothetical protein SS50377_27816 [Spironucleus salmonicida]|eukprot:EST48864.1 hypothetical protein SS50377_10964 [Spironucleus salmonicida]